MMKLTPEEQSWLDAYQMTLSKTFPGFVEEIMVFGSKARGDAGPDSDLDILVILREGDRALKREVRRVGHRLAVMANAVPSIMVYTKDEWSSRERSGSPFYQAVLRDGVPT